MKGRWVCAACRKEQRPVAEWLARTQQNSQGKQAYEIAAQSFVSTSTYRAPPQAPASVVSLRSQQPARKHSLPLTARLCQLQPQRRQLVLQLPALGHQSSLQRSPARGSCCACCAGGRPIVLYCIPADCLQDAQLHTRGRVRGECIRGLACLGQDSPLLLVTSATQSAERERPKAKPLVSPPGHLLPQLLHCSTLRLPAKATQEPNG